MSSMYAPTISPDTIYLQQQSKLLQQLQQQRIPKQILMSKYLQPDIATNCLGNCALNDASLMFDAAAETLKLHACKAEESLVISTQDALQNWLEADDQVLSSPALRQYYLCLAQQQVQQQAAVQQHVRQQLIQKNIQHQQLQLELEQRAREQQLQIELEQRAREQQLQIELEQRAREQQLLQMKEQLMMHGGIIESIPGRDYLTSGPSSLCSTALWRGSVAPSVRLSPPAEARNQSLGSAHGPSTEQQGDCVDQLVYQLAEQLQKLRCRAEDQSQLSDIQQMTPVADLMKNPPSNYMCHICCQTGHFIRDCPEAKNQEKGLTPYQGKKRCFGEYTCPKCKRRWLSGNSWANMAQDCIKCRVSVYPYRQRRLEKAEVESDETDTSKVHPQHLCEKCKQLGYYCRRTY